MRGLELLPVVGFLYIKSMNSILFASLLTSCTGGFIVLSYESLAKRNGWPVGKLFMNEVFTLIFGGLSILGSVGYSILQASFLWGLSILICGFILYMILALAFKSRVQSISLLLIFFSWVLQFFIKIPA